MTRVATAALVVAALASVTALAGCREPRAPRRPGPRPPHPLAPMRDAAVARWLAAAGDPAAIAAQLDAEVQLGGLWFADPACHARFAAPVRVASSDPALARCLAALPVARSLREHPLVWIAVLAQPSGLELEIAFAPRVDGPRVRWLGYAGRRSRDTAPSVTQAALEAHRTTPLAFDDDAARARLTAALAADREPVADAWFAVCVDATGAVTSVEPRRGASPAIDDELAAALRRTRYRPFVLAGQPTAVCALTRVQFPPTAPPPPDATRFPFPVPASDEDRLLVGARALRRARDTPPLIPDVDARAWIARQRVRRFESAFWICVSPRGAVTDARVLEPSGVPRFDDQIAAALRSWRYLPHVRAGRAVEACTVVRFVYRQEDPR